MKFKIKDEIFEKYPEVKIGILIVKGIDNKGKNEELLELILDIQKEIRKKFEKETLCENPKIKVWREAYSLFGAKPKKYKCSVENLYRMTLDNINLKHINKLVDLYNYISLKHIVPLGGDDLDNIDGEITLKFANGDENFIELNRDEVKNPKEGEVVYSDNKEILCRRWNWRECDKSKMTKETKNASLIVEGLASVSKEEIETILNELKELVEKYCGGETEVYVLDKDKGEI